MKKMKYPVFLGLVGLTAYACPVALAQGPAVSQAGHRHADDGHAGHTHDHDHGGEVLAFTLSKWHTMHFEDAAKAKKHAEMVTQLGCEVRQEAHSGHSDLTYRCTQWKSMKVASHELVEQWLGWLKGSGFDVSHGHVDPAYAKGAETVAFRLVNWKSIHGNGSEQEKQFVQSLQRLGCEVVTEDHGGHSDIRFRSPVWRDVHVADHAAAEQLGAWLKGSGFELAPHQH